LTSLSKIASGSSGRVTGEVVKGVVALFAQAEIGS
jgi:hypothetical protein